MKKDKLSLFTYIGIFIMLFYSFNCSLINIVFKQRISASLYILSFILIFLGTYGNFKKNKRNSIIFQTLIIVFLILFRNADIKNNAYATVIFSITPILCIPFLSADDNWKDYFIKLIKIFIFVHIIATFFCYLFPSFYYRHILPLFPGTRKELLYQFNHNQIAGITSHYSTNGLYLVIGLIFNSLPFFYKNKQKKIKNIILYLMNALALLLTGKRGMVFYYLLSLVLMIIIVNRGSIPKILKRTLPYIILFIIVIFLTSQFVPTITSSFSRIIDAMKDKDSFDSREILWNEAKNLYENNKMFGVGWENYKYKYYIDVIYKERNFMQTHCIYLQLLAETGIIGFLIFIITLIKLLIVALKENIKNPCNKYAFLFLMFLFYFIMEGATGNSIYDIQIYVTFYLSIAMFLSTTTSEYIENKNKKLKKEAIS